MLRKLPLSGVQDFTKIRTEYAVYIDKTAYIHNLISNYNSVFLSRPRRFGKSLTCSTIKAIFENKKDLFKGLAIEALPWEWKEYPVIHLDMSAENCVPGKDRLIELVNRYLKSHAENYGITLPDGNLSTKFEYLIQMLFKTKGKVVIIIDEYDCPLLDTIDYPEVKKEIKEELRGFYKVLKACDQYIQFVFITGITKFSQVSLFSGMNQPKDISLSAEYSALCGITQEELENYFDLEINEYSKNFGEKKIYLDKLKNFYNGYRFARNAISVYNPVSILNHFGDGDFRVYWAETGTPSFLANYIDKNGADLADIENMELPIEAFGKYNDDEITLVPLMYQAGYLTIKDYSELSLKYKLNYPNVEVRSSFANFLSNQYTGLAVLKKESYMNKLFNSLLNGDVDAFMETIKIYMQSVKFDLITKITEYYFEFAFANILNMMGFNCEIEVHSAVGSVDAIIKFQKNVFVIEAKLDKPVEEALRQIEEKKYYVPYLEKGCNIFKIGVVFGEKERNVVKWLAA
ncbi:MAG: ATP-binding protein [Candidatus Fibromonas sp.]|jgi:hypothetical protein|nr:ATP-binding protein [Candidatus Fibromonas sp.]